MPTATLDALTTRLTLKERELEALLQITQAVTEDRTEAELYKIYQFSLLGQLGIRQLALYGTWIAMRDGRCSTQRN